MVTNFKAIGTTTIKFVSIRKQHPSNWTVPCLCGQFAVSLRCFWFLSTATQSSQFFRRLLKRKGSCQNYKVASGTKDGFPTMESTSKLAAMTPLNFNAKFLANVPELPYVLARWFRCVFSSLLTPSAVSVTTLTFVRLAFSSNLFCVKSIKPIPCTKKNIALDVASRVRLTI